MSCANGRVAIKPQTKQRLFAESAGHCQNPACLENLLVNLEDNEFHIAELAHIIAARQKGPRGHSIVGNRNSSANLIVLCPNCHTKIDKAPLAYQEEMLYAWKREHAHKIQSVFGFLIYQTRQEARIPAEKLLRKNKAIFDYCSPEKFDRWNPECEFGAVWLKKVVSDIIPNNRKLLILMDANYSLLYSKEIEVLEKFRIHVEDLETKHLFKGSQTIASRFPIEMACIFEGG